MRIRVVFFFSLVILSEINGSLLPPKIGLNLSPKLSSYDSLSQIIPSLEEQSPELTTPSLSPSPSLKSSPINQDITKIDLKKAFKFSSYMFLWYFFTIVYNVANKNALNAFPLPAVVSTLQLMVGLPLFLPLWIVKRPSLNQSDFASFFIMSLMHALGIFSSVVALEAGSVSFTHIIKASEPVFAAIFSRILLGQQTSLPVYLSLLPIIGGVGFASLTDFKFSPRAFFPAMLSNIFYQLRIVLSKKFMLKSSSEKSSLTPSEMFQTLTVVSILLLTPIALFLEGNLISAAWTALNTASSTESLKSYLPFQLPFPLSEGAKHFITNIIISGLSFSLYNEIGFQLLNLIQPVSYAVANTIKRVIIIFASVWIFKTPMTSRTVVGSTVAIAGTLLYSLVQQPKQKKDSIVKEVAK